MLLDERCEFLIERDAPQWGEPFPGREESSPGTDAMVVGTEDQHRLWNLDDAVDPAGHRSRVEIAGVGSNNPQNRLSRLLNGYQALQLPAQLYWIIGIKLPGHRRLAYHLSSFRPFGSLRAHAMRPYNPCSSGAGGASGSSSCCSNLSVSASCWNSLRVGRLASSFRLKTSRNSLVVP